ncbi:tight adherence protein B [Cryobacterium sp. MP_3.1]|uniref:pilus assembly protein n=1 Tax=Cryobacterium sp. MP_3.1 TaxID=3071711 RepID=UPI002E009894|nr:tight adherence protein B [Cryobacterium sp. MP_3.1]
MSRRGAAPPPPIEEVARIAERLAVLLSAGVSPVSAWDYLLPPGPAGRAEPFDPSVVDRAGPPAPPAARGTRRVKARADAERAQHSILAAAGRAARNGDDVADAIADAAAGLPDQLGDAWRALAAAWDVATRAGAPLAGCLRDLAAAFRELGQLHRDLTVALTGPRATARLVMVLPLVALLFGSLMGFDTLRTLFLTGPGLACLAAGCLLMVGAARWNRYLVAAAGRQGPAPGLELDLTAIGMAGGGSLDRARASARRSAERFGLRAIGVTDSADVVIERVLDLSARAGVPAGELLRSEAAQARRDARTAGHQRAETLAVTLMIPLGVCVLPAFMLVGVAPLLLSVLVATLGSVE